MRYKSLGVFSGTFHSNSLSRKSTFPKALVAGGTRVGYEEVLPLCGHFWNYTCQPVLTGTSNSQGGAVNDRCSQERSCGGYCRNQFQTKPTFKKPTVTGKISSHPLRKKKTQSAQGQDTPPPYFIIGGMPINTARSQLPSDRMAILTISKQ